MHSARTLAACALAVVTLGALPGAAQAEDSSAVSVNTKDGSSVFRIVFQIKRTMDSDVDNDNAAVAYSNCTECQTVAVSIQVVLAMGDVENVDTDNVAIAINENCDSCQTMAAAFQYVFGNGGMVRFTADGQRRLALLRHRVARLRGNGKHMTLEEIDAELMAITRELEDILATELRPAGEEPASPTTTSTTEVPASSTTSTSTPSSTSSSTTSSTAP